MSAGESGRWTAEGSAFVEAFRADVDAPVDVDAAWARFGAALEPSRPTRARRGPWLAGALALAAAAVLLVWSTVPASPPARREAHDGVQAPDQALDRAIDGEANQGANHGANHGAMARPSAPASTTQTSVPEASEDHSGPSPAREGTQDDPRHGRQRRMPDREDDAEPSRLAQELRLIESMRAALQGERFSDALTHVRQHAQDFGDGPFAAERELSRVRALCGLRRFVDVRAAKARFAVSFPNNHLASVVQATCDERDERTDHDE